MRHEYRPGRRIGGSREICVLRLDVEVLVRCWDERRLRANGRSRIAEYARRRLLTASSESEDEDSNGRRNACHRRTRRQQPSPARRKRRSVLR